MIAVYCCGPEPEGWIKPALFGVDAEWAGDLDAERLRGVATFGGPPCVVVTPLSLERLQRLRALGRAWSGVVWAEEVCDRLVLELENIGWRERPLQTLGNRILATSNLRPVVEKALKIVCGLDANADRRKSNDAGQDSPPPMGWAVLLWAVPQRASKSWRRICRTGKYEKRSLERLARRLAGCTLGAVARDPQQLTKLFRAWVAERCDDPVRGPSRDAKQVECQR